MPDDELLTLEGPRGVDAGPRRMWPRLLGTVGLALVVLAGTLNLLGVATTHFRTVLLP